MLHPIEDSVIDHVQVPVGLIQLMCNYKETLRPGGKTRQLQVTSHGYHTVVQKFMSKEQTY